MNLPAASALPEPQPAVGSKRKNVNDLKEFTAAPSTFGVGADSVSLKGGTSWVQLAPKYDIKMHRPDPSMYGIHCTLLSECFALFKDDFGGAAVLSREDFCTAQEVCTAMSAFLTHPARKEAMNAILSRYLDTAVTILPVSSGGITADGGLSTQCGLSAANRMAAVMVEYKADMAIGNCTPVEQNIGYYIQCFRHMAAFARERSVCPSLLISVVGPYMSVSFAAHCQYVVIDPATPFVPLLVLPHDVDTMMQVARMLKAIKNCVGRLTAHYRELPPNTLSAEEFEQLQYPYKRSFVDHSSASCDFRYLRQLGKRLVFEAEVTAAGARADVQVGARILVKFTRTYCSAAHKVCEALVPPAAPRLHAETVMPGGWICVVMDFITDAVHFEAGQGGQAANDLSRAVTALHANNFVHADLRQQNILVSSGRAFLVDFDWSGTEGQQIYPPFMNHVGVQWANDAGDLLPLKKSHDVHFMNKLL